MIFHTSILMGALQHPLCLIHLHISSTTIHLTCFGELEISFTCTIPGRAVLTGVLTLGGEFSISYDVTNP